MCKLRPGETLCECARKMLARERFIAEARAELDRIVEQHRKGKVR